MAPASPENANQDGFLYPARRLMFSRMFKTLTIQEFGHL
jgi:hypothetical protein